MWSIQSVLCDTKSQTLLVSSSQPEQSGTTDNSSETQSQRSPDGSEDGDSSQSKSRNITSLYTCCCLWYVILIPAIGPDLPLLWKSGEVSKCNEHSQCSHLEQTVFPQPDDHCTLDHSYNCRGSCQSSWINSNQTHPVSLVWLTTFIPTPPFLSSTDQLQQDPTLSAVFFCSACLQTVS